MYEIHLLLLVVNTFSLLFIFTDKLPRYVSFGSGLLDKLEDKYPRFTIWISLTWFYSISYFTLNIGYFVRVIPVATILWIYVLAIFISIYAIVMAIVSFDNICWRHN